MLTPSRTLHCTLSDSISAPDAAPLARGRLADRKSTKRNPRRLAQRRFSPGFLTLGPSPICFPMTVLRRDLGDEFRKFILSPNRTQDNTSLPVESQRHRISLGKTNLLRYRKGNTDRQAVPPFRNPGIISHGCLYFEYTPQLPRDRPPHGRNTPKLEVGTRCSSACLHLRRVQKRDHLTASPAVNPEIAHIRRDDRQRRIQFAEPDEAQIGEIRIAVRITLREFRQP